MKRIVRVRKMVTAMPRAMPIFVDLGREEKGVVVGSEFEMGVCVVGSEVGVEVGREVVEGEDGSVGDTVANGVGVIVATTVLIAEAVE